MIVGLVGAICSGKRTMAEYLREYHGFTVINILDEFREEIKDMDEKDL